MTKEPVIVDSSVIVKWISQQDERYLKQADLLLQNVQRGHIVLYAPELAKYEVGNAMLHKGAPLVQTKTGSATIYTLPIHFVSETKELSLLTTEIAYRFSMTFYDASFVALADVLEGTLITDNIKHQGRILTVRVVPLAHYRAKK